MAAIGRVIDGRYVVEAELGSGGMGVVLRVRHKFTGALHALKMLRPDYALDAEAQNRFLAEARAATAIGHHGIVQVLDAGKTPEGELYLVMELLQGQPLRGAITRTGIAPPQLRQIGLELLDALGAAHDRGFVHRDLKPENVFLVMPHGTAKLLDFGIAKIAQSIEMTAMPRTAAGVVLGTLAYMAPEQLHDARSVDRRADLWACGAMFFEMLCGRLPWTARTMTELYIQLESEQPTPIQHYLPGAPPQVAAFFARALARDPKARFQTTQEMAAALAALPFTQAAPVPGVAQTMMTGGAWQGASGGMSATQMTGATVYPSVAHGRVGAAQSAAPSPTHAPVVQPRAAIPPPQPHPITHQVAPLAPPPATKNWAAIGLAVVAAGLILTAVVVATRGRGHTSTTEVAGVGKPLPDPHVVSAQGQTVELTDHPERGPPPPDAASSQQPQVGDAPTPPTPITPVGPRTIERKPVQPVQAVPAAQPMPPVTPAPTQLADSCAAGCKLLAPCGLQAPTCVHDCMANAGARACIASGSCNGFAACMIGGLCGMAAPRGTLSCSGAQTCQQSQCAVGDVACGCRCASMVNPEHAPALLKLDLCLLNCRFDPTCMGQRCGGFATACSAE